MAERIRQFENHFEESQLREELADLRELAENSGTKFDKKIVTRLNVALRQLRPFGLGVEDLDTKGTARDKKAAVLYAIEQAFDFLDSNALASTPTPESADAASSPDITKVEDNVPYGQVEDGDPFEEIDWDTEGEGTFSQPPQTVLHSSQSDDASTPPPISDDTNPPLSAPTTQPSTSVPPPENAPEKKVQHIDALSNSWPYTFYNLAQQCGAYGFDFDNFSAPEFVQKFRSLILPIDNSLKIHIFIDAVRDNIQALRNAFQSMGVNDQNEYVAFDFMDKVKSSRVPARITLANLTTLEEAINDVEHSLLGKGPLGHEALNTVESHIQFPVYWLLNPTANWNKRGGFDRERYVDFLLDDNPYPRRTFINGVEETYPPGEDLKLIENLIVEYSQLYRSIPGIGDGRQVGNPVSLDSADAIIMTQGLRDMAQSAINQTLIELEERRDTLLQQQSPTPPAGGDPTLTPPDPNWWASPDLDPQANRPVLEDAREEFLKLSKERLNLEWSPEKREQLKENLKEAQTNYTEAKLAALEERIMGIDLTGKGEFRIREEIGLAIIGFLKEEQEAVDIAVDVEKGAIDSIKEWWRSKTTFKTRVLIQGSLGVAFTAIGMPYLSMASFSFMIDNLLESRTSLFGEYNVLDKKIRRKLDIEEGATLTEVNKERIRRLIMDGALVGNTRQGNLNAGGGFITKEEEKLVDRYLSGDKNLTSDQLTRLAVIIGETNPEDGTPINPQEFADGFAQTIARQGRGREKEKGDPNFDVKPSRITKGVQEIKAGFGEFKGEMGDKARETVRELKGKIFKKKKDGLSDNEVEQIVESLRVAQIDKGYAIGEAGSDRDSIHKYAISVLLEKDRKIFAERVIEDTLNRSIPVSQNDRRRRQYFEEVVNDGSFTRNLMERLRSECLVRDELFAEQLDTRKRKSLVRLGVAVGAAVGVGTWLGGVRNAVDASLSDVAQGLMVRIPVPKFEERKDAENEKPEGGSPEDNPEISGLNVDPAPVEQGQIGTQETFENSVGSQNGNNFEGQIDEDSPDVESPEPLIAAETETQRGELIEYILGGNATPDDWEDYLRKVGNRSVDSIIALDGNIAPPDLHLRTQLVRLIRESGLQPTSFLGIFNKQTVRDYVEVALRAIAEKKVLSGN